MTATATKTCKTNAKCTAHLTSLDKFHQVGNHGLWPSLSNPKHHIPEKSVRSSVEAPSAIRSGMMVDGLNWIQWLRDCPSIIMASEAGDMAATISGVIPPGP